MSFSQAKVANDNRFQQCNALFTLSPEGKQGAVMGRLRQLGDAHIRGARLASRTGVVRDAC
jgi:hypothetical protein